jgi:hypothetical protein
MLTNECHGCENYIEFPDHGVGEEIHCPHCGLPVVLTDSTKTRPPTSGDPHLLEQKLELRKSFGHAKGDDLLRTAEPNKPSPLEAQVTPKARPSAGPIPIQYAAIAGGALFLIVVLAWVSGVLWRHKPAVVVSAEHQEAISRLEQDALAVRAPPGLFGTKWLMSPGEVMKLATNAKPLYPGVLSENRSLYDRQARVSYHFANDALLLIEVTFVGPSTDADFTQTQARLAADYGKMPAPLPFEKCLLSSRKKMGPFVVQHCLSESSGAQSERLLLYAGKGGENLLRKQPEASPVQSKTRPPADTSYPAGAVRSPDPR